MANNRMRIKCNICGDQFLLCKYYPSTSWYQLESEEGFNEWLKKHDHLESEKVDSMWGNQEFSLEFEMK